MTTKAKTPINNRSGITKDTAKRYVIDTATVYTDVEFTTEGGFVGNLIGATNGGVTLAIENQYRDIELDSAKLMKLKGNKVLESANATVTVKLKELSAENLRMAINGKITEAADDVAPAGYHVIESKSILEDSDYLGNVAFVGRISGTDKPIIAILDNAIVTSPLSMETEDSNEVVQEIVFEASATFDQLQTGEFPWRILYPEVA
ncbi:hypothetical protein [Erysipelothrix anatis]|uniref:hypothetical protein n=1 Tax=Erysipelothrix anatis TaxID=2683713 RepID=UPI001408DEFD|nr:hypothetical protein [Erysipelothrix anatis]